MTIHRQLLRDYASKRCLRKPRADEWPTLIQLAQGIVCIGLVMVMLFLLWQIFTPAGKAALWDFAVYIWEAV